MNEFVTVILIKQGVVEEVFLFSGKNKTDITLKAETKFLELCKENISNWDEYTKDDMDALLEDGYSFGINNTNICINWPITE